MPNPSERERIIAQTSDRYFYFLRLASKTYAHVFVSTMDERKMSEREE